MSVSVRPWTAKDGPPSSSHTDCHINVSSLNGIVLFIYQNKPF